jgi:hypothetical protein
MKVGTFAAAAVFLVACASAQQQGQQKDLSAQQTEEDLSGGPTFLDLSKPNADAGPDLYGADLKLPVDMTMVDLAPDVCATAMTTPASVSDAQIIYCATNNRLGKCHVQNCSSGCACASYVKVDGICGTGGCGAPLNGSGCSDSGYYTGSPWNCTTPETACMLKKLVSWSNCQ